MSPRMLIETDPEQDVTPPMKVEAPKPVVERAAMDEAPVVSAEAPKPTVATIQDREAQERKTVAPKPVVERPLASEPVVASSPAPKAETASPKPAVAPKASVAPAPERVDPEEPKSSAQPKVETRILPEDELPRPDAGAAQQERVAEEVQPKRKVPDVGGWVHTHFPGHEHAFWGAIIALVVAILIFAIGFFRVLLIIMLVVVGIAIGQVLDGDPKIIGTIRDLMRSDRE